MSRKAWLQLVLPLIGLSVLFWLLAFAPGEKHHQPPLLEMSVILRDGDGAVSTMRKGMEQAAQDLNVELRFLIPAEDNSAAQQAQLLEREVTGAASAVLLIPADREALGDAVSAAAGKTTLVTVETDMTAWGAAASITMDHQELGAALGAAALNGVPEGGTVLLLDSLPGDNGIRERMEAAKAVLEREGRQARVYKWDPDTTSLPDILRIERPRAIIAFEAAALADVAELSRGGGRLSTALRLRLHSEHCRRAGKGACDGHHRSERILRRVSGGGGRGGAGAARGLDSRRTGGIFHRPAGDHVRQR